MSILAHVFEEEGALDRLEAFTSINGATFYRLPQSERTLSLTKGKTVTYPAKIDTDVGPVTVFDPGFTLNWRVGD